MVEAFAGLPPDTTLVMLAMNEDAAYRSRIEALVSELGIGSRVRILPEAGEEIAALYRAAEVVVSVPESDGVPVTVLEAMASERPVVAVNLPGVRDWLGEVEPELLVPVGDVGATREALQRVLDMPEAERTTLAHRLRQVVAERASRQRNMEMVEAWYRQVARGGRP